MTCSSFVAAVPTSSPSYITLPDLAIHPCSSHHLPRRCSNTVCAQLDNESSISWWVVFAPIFVASVQAMPIRVWMIMHAGQMMLQQVSPGSFAAASQPPCSAL
jgi:hypothetical protein